MSRRVALDWSHLLASFKPIQSIRRTVTVLFSVVLTICVAVPALPASEGEGQGAAEPDVAESAQSEDQVQEDARKKNRKCNPFKECQAGQEEHEEEEGCEEDTPHGKSQAQVS